MNIYLGINIFKQETFLRQRQLWEKGGGKLQQFQCVEFCYWEEGVGKGKNKILLLGKKQTNKNRQKQIKRKPL